MGTVALPSLSMPDRIRAPVRLRNLFRRARAKCLKRKESVAGGRNPPALVRLCRGKGRALPLKFRAGVRRVILARRLARRATNIATTIRNAGRKAVRSGPAETGPRVLLPTRKAGRQRAESG